MVGLKKNIQFLTPGQLDADNVRNYLKKRPDEELEISTFMKKLILNNDNKFEKARNGFQKFISENGLSSHMVAICKKEVKHIG